MNRSILFLIFVSVFAGLNLGSIRREENPILNTQTNPILYEQKKEEEKDGKKGPLMYHVKNNPRESFFIDPPFEKDKKSPARELATEKASSSGATADWWEEQPKATEAVSPTETVSETLPEPLPEAAKVRDPEVAKPAALVAGTQDVPPGKGDDYWW